MLGVKNRMRENICGIHSFVSSNEEYTSTSAGEEQGNLFGSECTQPEFRAKVSVESLLPYLKQEVSFISPRPYIPHFHRNSLDCNGIDIRF